VSEQKTLKPNVGTAQWQPEAAQVAPRASILLVDDQPARLLTYEAILNGLEVQCVRATSGNEALERLLKQEFAVILLDVQMPGMDGFEVARLVREHPRMERTPIIFVTGVHVSEFDRLKGYEVGAIDYIAVPVVPEILRSKVALLVELHLRRSQLKSLNSELTQTRARLEAEHAKALADLNARLRESDERKDEFLAMLAHELRNPIAPISNAAEVLSRLLQHDSNATAMIAMIKRQCSHLGRLLDDLLDVARITQGRIQLQREQLAIAGIVELAIETVQPLLQAKGHRLTVIVDSQPLFVHADKVRLEQCVMNLLTNAIKYTEPGGQIRVRHYPEGGHAVIEVTDTGVGIAAEFLPRMFDLFAQSERSLDRSQGGLGIGLAICKQIMGLHGGSIECRSAGVGQGATFTIRLPIAESAVHIEPAAPCAAERQRVLVVDDNRDAADSLALLLRLEGHETHTVYSPEEALEQAIAFRPQTILLDIGLPRVDGYEVARRIKAIAGSIRLIALSGYGQDHDRQRSTAAGFDAHLIKPVELDKLRELLWEPGPQ
jgi:signal transduction histidine kinase